VLLACLMLIFPGFTRLIPLGIAAATAYVALTNPAALATS
jgi:hypothetical protein